MSNILKNISAASAVSLLALMAAGLAHADTPTANPPAADAAQDQSSTVGEIVVVADKAGLIEKRPNDTVFGLTKPLIETPRSASLVSDVTIQRYGIRTIDDFVAVSPSTYTASFYGVAGSLNVRGTLADNYFQGFKLVENRGTYTTPVGDAARIDIVRGPPSPVYGPGKVGGYLNFVPKSVGSESLTRVTGEAEVTYGAYDNKILSGQVGGPLDLGVATGGVYAYAEIEDSGSYFNGIHPRHQMGEVSVDYSLPGGWRITGDALIYHSTGDVQSPGWNRLTPQLIGSRTYVTGRNTTLVATPGAPYLTPDQATPGEFSPYPFNFTAIGGGLYDVYFGQTITTPPAPPFQLNSPGAGTTVTLDRHSVFISPLDFSESFAPVAVLGLEKDLPNDATLKLQLFYNGVENKRFVSYGFPAWFRASAYEARASYDFKLSGWNGAVTANTIVGGSWRYYQGRDMQSFNSGMIAVDRRDLSAGATPTDSMCDPFTAGVLDDRFPSNCLGWENDVHSIQNDAGLFITSDIMVGKRFDLILGARYDNYRVTSSDTGILPFESTNGPVSASKGDVTWSASASYKLGFGLMPYVTYARAGALEVQQAGDLQPQQVASGGWLSRSDLVEGGVKFQWLDGRLIGALDAYRQERTALSGLNTVTQRTRSTGFELEARWLATRNLSFTFSANSQHTEVLGPDHQTEYVGAYAVCGNSLACELNSWGGAYLIFDYSASPLGRPGNYELTSIPHGVVSVYGNYISDTHPWGKAGVTLGVTHVTQTSGTVVNAIVYPGYYVANASAFYRNGPWELELNIDNLGDTLYFTPAADQVFVNVVAQPSAGRTWRLTLKRDF